jgi:hypothetical protein
MTSCRHKRQIFNRKFRHFARRQNLLGVEDFDAD